MVELGSSGTVDISAELAIAPRDIHAIDGECIRRGGTIRIGRLAISQNVKSIVERPATNCASQLKEML